MFIQIYTNIQNIIQKYKLYKIYKYIQNIKIYIQIIQKYKYKMYTNIHYTNNVYYSNAYYMYVTSKYINNCINILICERVYLAMEEVTI